MILNSSSSDFVRRGGWVCVRVEKSADPWVGTEWGGFGCKKRMSNDGRSQTITHSPLSSAVWTGLEPATPCVTGRYSNQLNYHTKLSLALRRLSFRSTLPLFPFCECKVKRIFNSVQIFLKKNDEKYTALSFKIWSHSRKMCYFIARAVRAERL